MRRLASGLTVLAIILAGGCHPKADTQASGSDSSKDATDQMAAMATDNGVGISSIKPDDCGGFTAADAAAIEGAPADQWSRNVEQIHESLWSCSLATKDDDKQIVFSIEVARNAADAAADMEQYRSHLGDNYSDLMGLGDEGVWTEVNKTVTYRKQNVTVQVQQPPDKIAQLKVVKAIFDRN